MTASKPEASVAKPVKAAATLTTASAAHPAPAAIPSKAVVKTAATAKVKAAPRKAKTSVKPIAVAQPKAVPAPKPKAAPKPKLAAKPKVEKPAKEKKPKLVRDSFTIPKPEYAVLDDLKARSNRLASPAKKSELLRAGIKALAAMSDAAFQAALRAVPAIKTGRPTKE